MYWGKVYRKLKTAFEQGGGRCVVDCAFSKGEYPFLVKSFPDSVNNAADMGAVAVSQQETSTRQASEWERELYRDCFLALKIGFCTKR